MRDPVAHDSGVPNTSWDSTFLCSTLLQRTHDPLLWPTLWHAGSSTMELISNNAGVGFPRPQLGSMKREIFWKAHMIRVSVRKSLMWLPNLNSNQYSPSRVRQFRKKISEKCLFFSPHQQKKTILKLWERNSGGLAKSDRQGWQANYLMVLGS